MVKNSVGWVLGIVVHRFRLLFKVDKLAGRYFTICCDEVLDKHEQGSVKLASCPVSPGCDLFGFNC